MKITIKLRPARNVIVTAMMERSQKAGAHKDRKKESKRKAGRKWSEDD